MQTSKIPTEELREIVGADNVREAGAADAIDGVQPSLVTEPGSVEEASGVLELARREGLAVAARGAGTKMALGEPPRDLDLILSTRRMSSIVEHVAGDQIVKVRAGIRLEDLQEGVSEADQMLAIDPPEEGATIGGIVAANASGPRRLQYGTIRDLIIGITVVLSDGTVAKAGGKVVKNVAGYDLSKLFTGSLGTLGLIAEATFRLHPVPETKKAVAVDLDGPQAAGEAIRAIRHSQTEPSAAELRWDEEERSLTVLIEGLAPGVEARTEEVKRLLSPFGEAREAEFSPHFPEDETVVKLAFPPAELAGVLAVAEEVGAAVSGHAVSGVLFARLSGEGQAERVREMRKAALECGDSAVLCQAPHAVKQEVESWGPVGDAFELTRRVKERFDPPYVMNPGRFVGGI